MGANRDALQRYNIHDEDVNRVVETALAGGDVGTLIEGNRRFPIVVRLAEPLRMDVEAMKRLPLRTDEGVTHSELAALAIPAERIERFEDFVTRRGDRLVATPRGRPVLDRVIAELADAR